MACRTPSSAHKVVGVGLGGEVCRPPRRPRGPPPLATATAADLDVVAAEAEARPVRKQRVWPALAYLPGAP